MRVDTYRTITQTIYFGYQDWTGCVATRYWYHGTQKWSDWEWINPPIVFGVEYRTTERYNWEPVYIKTVNFGTLPNSTTKAVSHGISEAFSLVSLEGTAISSNDSCLIPFGLSGEFAVYSYINNTGIAVRTMKDASNYSAKFKVKYIKTMGGTITP